MTTTNTPIVTRLKLPAFRSFVESTAWAIHPERGRALLDMLEARATDRFALSPAANDTIAVRQAGRSDQRTVTKSGGLIAVLPMYGVIAQRFDMMMAYCGGTSTEAFADAFDAAMADPNVSAIVIDCDSPGGSVQGTPELAKRIMNARGKGKQIVAVSNGCMASAAYWICSAADEVVASPSAEVGSIGVFCVHVDQSAMNEMVGLKYTLIKAGDHKAEMNPWEPLSPDAKNFALGQVEEMNDMFVGAVAKQRGASTKAINDDYGQGRCFTAKQALAAGMIDRIATLEDTLEAPRREERRRERASGAGICAERPARRRERAAAAHRHAARAQRGRWPC
jgi:signal peptide peptidase SppA